MRQQAFWWASRLWQAPLHLQTVRNQCWCDKNAPRFWCHHITLSYQFFQTVKKMVHCVWRRTVRGRCQILSSIAGKNLQFSSFWNLLIGVVPSDNSSQETQTDWSFWKVYVCVATPYFQKMLVWNLHKWRNDFLYTLISICWKRDYEYKVSKTIIHAILHP